MSNIQNMLKQHTVMVEEASGVLINPTSGDHSYIITAKHNLQHKTKADEIIVKDHMQQPITLDNVYIHDDLDLAILITKEILDLSLHIHNAPLERGLSICFFGYPSCRRNLPIITNELPGVIQHIDAQLVLSLEHPIGHKEIVGMSGGGIFHIENQQIFLCGIETDYGGSPDIEFTTNILAIPLHSIQNFIKEKELPELSPRIIRCFTDVIPKTFDYFHKNCSVPANVQFLTDSLHKLIQKMLSTCTKPREIYTEFNEKLLALHCSKIHFYDDKLWSSFLEFLLINKLLDGRNQVDLEYLSSLSSKRKYIFIDCHDNWIRSIDRIYQSDLRELMKDGIIIVSSYESKPYLDIPKNIHDQLIPNIGRAISSYRRVDQAIKNPLQDFKIYHLAGLHSRILDRETEFYQFYEGNDGAGEPEMHQLFIEVYREHITN